MTVVSRGADVRRCDDCKRKLMITTVIRHIGPYFVSDVRCDDCRQRREQRDALAHHIMVSSMWPDAITPNPCVVRGED